MFRESADVVLATRCILRNDQIKRSFNSGVLTLGCLAALDYRNLRRQLFSTPLSKDNFFHYYKSVAFLERNRPDPWGLEHPGLGKVEDYRFKTNLVYWAAACTAAGIADMPELVTSDFSYAPSSPSWFIGMHNFLLGLQVIDDKIGWKGDMKAKRPSFFTALCPGEYLYTQPSEFPREVIKKIYSGMDERLQSRLCGMSLTWYLQVYTECFKGYLKLS